MRSFDIVVAMDEERGIGKGGTLPWHLKADLKYFKNLTTRVTSPDKKNIVIMGRKTWSSLPDNFKPLPDRINVVLTRQKILIFPPEVIVKNNLDEAVLFGHEQKNKGLVEYVFVIGGGEIFKEAIDHPDCDKIFVTHILGSFQCSSFFPPFEDNFNRVKSSPQQQEGHLRYSFNEYSRKN